MPDRQLPLGLRPEAPAQRHERYRCTVCGGEEHGAPDNTVDDRWITASCRTCRKRRIFARVSSPEPLAVDQ